MEICLMAKEAVLASLPPTHPEPSGLFLQNQVHQVFLYQTSPWCRPQLPRTVLKPGVTVRIRHLQPIWSYVTVLRHLQKMFTQANRAAGGHPVFVAVF